jgi:hypothetical protein
MGVIASYIDSDDKADVVGLIPIIAKIICECLVLEIVPGLSPCHNAGYWTVRADRE